jgi:hypothetical protein
VADVKRLEAAFVQAHKAGDTSAANKLAAAIRHARANTLDSKVEKEFGLQAGIERPKGLLPMPGKIDPSKGGLANADWTNWTAPEWVSEMARGVALPSYAMEGGNYSGSDVTRAAMSAMAPAGRSLKQPSIPRDKLSLDQALAAPDAPALKARGAAAYEAAERSGVVIKDSSILGMLGGLENKLLKAADPDLAPEAFRTFDGILKRLGNRKDFKELMVIRDLAADVANNFQSPRNARLGAIMVRHVDDFIDNIKPSDLDFGTGKQAMKAAKDLKLARQEWGKYRRTEMIDDIFRNAELQASGFENGLRIGFRQLLKNKKKIRGFSPEEVKAMENVVKGSNIANALKKLSKLGFGKGQQTNVLGGTAGTAVFGVGAPIAGAIGSHAGESATNKAAAMARGMVAGAKPAPRPSSTIPYRAGLLPFGGMAAGELGGEIDAEKPMYGSPGLLFYDKRI